MEPNPINTEFVEPINIDALIRVVEILKSAAFCKCRAGRIGVGYVKFIHSHVACGIGCDDDSVVSDA